MRLWSRINLSTKKKQFWSSQHYLLCPILPKAITSVPRIRLDHDQRREAILQSDFRNPQTETRPTGSWLPCFKSSSTVGIHRLGTKYLKWFPHNVFSHRSTVKISLAKNINKIRVFLTYIILRKLATSDIVYLSKKKFKNKFCFLFELSNVFYLEV